MGSLLFGARMLLFVVFLAAGIGKLLDLPGSRRALGEFGVPARALGVTAITLPLAELATAVAVMVPQSARWGALAALALLLAFIAGIARALSRGEAPDCHCFGQLHSAPAGRGTLARNGLLAAVAGVVVWRGPGPAVDTWIAARSAAELAAVLAGAAAAVLAATALRLWLENRTLRADLIAAREELAALPPGLPVGTPAPSFTFPDLRGELVSLESLCDRGRPVVLLFMSPDCGGCKPLMPMVGRWQATLGERLTFAVVSMGSPEENRPAFEEHGIGDVLLQGDGIPAMSDFRLQATPTAVVVNPDGIVASAPAVGTATIEPLVRVVLRREAAAAPALA